MLDNDYQIWGIKGDGVKEIKSKTSSKNILMAPFEIVIIVRLTYFLFTLNFYEALLNELITGLLTFL